MNNLYIWWIDDGPAAWSQNYLHRTETTTLFRMHDDWTRERAKLLDCLVLCCGVRTTTVRISTLKKTLNGSQYLDDFSDSALFEIMKIGWFRLDAKWSDTSICIRFKYSTAHGGWIELATTATPTNTETSLNNRNSISNGRREQRKMAVKSQLTSFLCMKLVFKWNAKHHNVPSLLWLFPFDESNSHANSCTCIVALELRVSWFRRREFRYLLLISFGSFSFSYPSKLLSGSLMLIGILFCLTMF